MEKILLVEDDSFMLKSLQRLLTTRGYDVVTATSGLEALDKAGKDEFALVISDVRMPGMDGIETLGKLGSVQPLARKIMITGYAEDEAPIRAIQLSVDDYLKKPFGSEIFLKSIEVALSRFHLEKEKNELVKSSYRQVDCLISSLVSKNEEAFPDAAARMERLVATCAGMGEHLRLPQDRLDLMKNAALSHDLGHLLGKPGGDSKQHAKKAFEILHEVPGFEEIAGILLHHHDETGRPVEAELLSLAESYENLISSKGLSPEQALKALQEEHPTLSDPRFLESLSSVSREMPSQVSPKPLPARRYSPLLHLAQTYTLIGEVEMGRAALEKLEKEESQSSLFQAPEFKHRFLLVSSQNMIRRGDYSDGMKRAEEAHRLAEESGLGKLSAARAGLEISHAVLLLGDAPDPHLADCEKVFDEFQDRWSQARACLYLALRLLRKGEKEAANPLLERCQGLIPEDQRSEWVQAESLALGLPFAGEIRRWFLPSSRGEMKVHFLGPLRVYRDGNLVKEEEWKTKKAKLLLAYLIFNREKAVPEERLFDLFWQDNDAEKARKNLHHTVYVLRRVLEPDLEEGSQSRFILSKKTTYQLQDTGLIWWDVAEIKKRFQEGEAFFSKGEEEKGASAFQQAERLYQGELLEEFLEESWCQPEREKLNEIYQNCLLRLAAYHEKGGNYAASLDLADKVLAQDPLHEKAAVQKVRSLYRGGQRSEAIRRYHDWCERLKRELKLAPPPELLSLYLEMTGGVST